MVALCGGGSYERARQSTLAIAISLAGRDGAEIGPELTLVVHRELRPPQLFPQMHCLGVHYGSIESLTAYPDTGGCPLKAFVVQI